MGGAAIMCTNKPQYWRTAKYQLMHNVRVHTGADDSAYKCVVGMICCTNTAQMEQTRLSSAVRNVTSLPCFVFAAMQLHGLGP